MEDNGELEESRYLLLLCSLLGLGVDQYCYFHILSVYCIMLIMTDMFFSFCLFAFFSRSLCPHVIHLSQWKAKMFSISPCFLTVAV